MATRPKGYRPKGGVKSIDAVRKAKARETFTPRGLASLVGNAVLSSPAGRAGGAAKASSKVMLAIRREMRKKSAGVGQGKKISSVAARREAERSAGRKARSIAGNPNRTSSTGAIRATAPKPGVRVTTRTSGGRGIASRAEGPSQRTVVKLTKRAEGPLRPGEKRRIATKKVVVERMPPKSTNTEKVTVTRPVKRSTNKEGGAVTITRKPPMTAKEIAENKINKNVAAKTARSQARTEKPTRKATGKVIQGPKTNPRTVNVAKPSKATDANKLITAPRTRMGDPAKGDIPKQTESRRIALRNAASDKRNTFKPTDRTPKERELEQVPDRIEIRRSGSSKEFDPQVTEAERRVSEGLRNRTGGEYELGKGKKPDMPNSRAVGERARQRPGIRKRQEASIAESRIKANTAMNKKGLTPAEKRTLIMKSRAKARKIREGTK